MHFADLGLSSAIVDAVTEKGYQTPTPIQQQAIPVILQGRDMMAAAQTGTGKTAGFTLPLLHRLAEGPRAKANQVRALILTPTRELAAQVGDNVAWYRKNLQLSSFVVFGGVKINPQMRRLCQGTDVLVATPGRLLDLYQQNAVRFDQLEVLILDEADRMLDMGFITDIRRIIKFLPAERQNLMFSATFSPEIKGLAKGILRNPAEIAVAAENATANLVEQWIYPCDKNKKMSLLAHVIKTENWHQVLVFCRTKHGADRLAKQLSAASIRAEAIHGDKSQGSRTRVLKDFKAGKVQVLVATDIAARGLDISQLPYVVNVDLPHVPEDYVHRIGRTGRAGESGVAISLVCAEDVKQLGMIQRLIQQRLQRKVVPGFEPSEKVPDVKLDKRPFKEKKPKKNKGFEDIEEVDIDPWNDDDGIFAEETRPKNRFAKKSLKKPAPEAGKSKSSDKFGSKPKFKDWPKSDDNADVWSSSKAKGKFSDKVKDKFKDKRKSDDRRSAKSLDKKSEPVDSSIRQPRKRPAK